MLSASMRVAAAAAWLIWCGCESAPVWPFPAVDAPSDADVHDVLASRVAGVTSLYAELRMSYEAPGGDGGVFDAATYYQAPDKLRFTAYRDGFISTTSLFDVAITKESYTQIVRDSDGSSRRLSGSHDELQHEEGFAVLAVLRQHLFLPGVVDAFESGAVQTDSGSEGQRLASVVRTDSELLLETELHERARVQWSLDPITLGVRSAEVRSGTEVAETTRVEYLSYSQVDGRFFPETFEIVSPAARIFGRVVYLEVNPELEADLFMLPDD